MLGAVLREGGLRPNVLPEAEGSSRVEESSVANLPCPEQKLSEHFPACYVKQATDLPETLILCQGQAGFVCRAGMGQGKETGGWTGKSTLKTCCLFLSFLIRAHYKYMAV